MNLKVYRPTSEGTKINSKNEFELCYLRHQYLRKVDYNPSLEEMKPYVKIVEHMSRNTFYSYRYLFSNIGMGLEDIVNIGRVQIVNFIGLFEFNENKNVNRYQDFFVSFFKNKKSYPNAKDVIGKNKANFTMFMKQRMEDLIRICLQKVKNIKGFRSDEYVAFYGPNPPPSKIYDLLNNNKFYGFKILDNVSFKAIKKRLKAKVGEPFQFSGSWYIAVPIQKRNLTVLDFSGAGLDPYESMHNMDPEKILQEKQKEITFDKKHRIFENSSREEKAKTLLDFIEKNIEREEFTEEIRTAKKYLKDIGFRRVR